mmetsp:Transcript_3220/g.8114  ORF Transcript_3220/g.8114 Transcript_3220/m.8114 type:complete len:255 (+) Transcript_3220:87-851(+)
MHLTCSSHSWQIEQGTKMQPGNDDTNDGFQTVPSRRRKKYKDQSNSRTADTSNDNGGPDFPPFLSSVALAPLDADNSVPGWQDPVHAQARCMLLLVGYPGSGKSTFSQKLQEMLPAHYARINQDELKNRKQCIAACRSILDDPAISPIVDRCNISRQQRKYFVDLVEKSYPGVSVDCIWFQVDKKNCQRRCHKRRNHPTLHPSQVASVLGAMEKEYEPPTVSEGFRYCHVIHNDPKSFLAILQLYINRIVAVRM